MAPPETCRNLNYFAHTRKKDLTALAFALILAQATPFTIVVALLLARARQNCQTRAILI